MRLLYHRIFGVFDFEYRRGSRDNSVEFHTKKTLLVLCFDTPLPATRATRQSGELTTVLLLGESGPEGRGRFSTCHSRHDVDRLVRKELVKRVELSYTES